MCTVPGCDKRYTDPSSLRKHLKNHSPSTVEGQNFGYAHNLENIVEESEQVFSSSGGLLSFGQLQNAESFVYNGCHQEQSGQINVEVENQWSSIIVDNEILGNSFGPASQDCWISA